MRIVVITHLASPYQVEFFNWLLGSEAIDFEVVYLHRTSYQRSWQATPLLHKHICLDEDPGRFREARQKVIDADLAVFNYYTHILAVRLLNARTTSGKPWCFWGERPGFRKPEWIGQLLRRCCLSPLQNSLAPIWGIGQFAVQRYQKEFGMQRAYCNIPYFSDLQRFQNGFRSSKPESAPRVFLFSGSLIRRKGADLVARAFLRLAREFLDVRIKFIGDGKLRPRLEQTLKSIRDRVEFLGFKDWQDLPIYYRGADILCVPSRYDGWGLVVPEGLAAGLPVIATRSMGAAVEFIETGHNGWLVPERDESALISAMREAAALPDATLAEMSRHARASVNTHSLQHGVQRFVQAAQDALTSWQR